MDLCLFKSCQDNTVHTQIQLQMVLWVHGELCILDCGHGEWEGSILPLMCHIHLQGCTLILLLPSTRGSTTYSMGHCSTRSQGTTSAISCPFRIISLIRTLFHSL